MKSIGWPGAILAAFLFLLPSAGRAAEPATAVAEPSLEQKVETLSRLLDDPQIRALIAEREAKADQPQAAPETGAGGMRKTGLSTILEDFRDHVRLLNGAMPGLAQELRTATGMLRAELQEKGAAYVILLVAGFVGCGFAADWLAHRLTRGFRAWMLAQSHRSQRGRSVALFARILYGLLMLAAFALGSAGFFLLFEWPPVLQEVILSYLGAATAARAALVMFRCFLLPPFMGLEHAAEYRVLPMDEARSGHWYAWTALVSIWIAFVTTSLNLLEAAGLSAISMELLAVPADTVLAALLIAAVWLRPAGPTRNSKAVTWSLTAFFVLLWLLRLSGSYVGFWLVFAFVFLPAVLVGANRAVRYVLRAPGEEIAELPLSPLRVAVIERGARILVLLVGAFLLARAVELDSAIMASGDGLLAKILRGGIKAAAILLAADFVWAFIKSLISRRMGMGLMQNGPGDHDEGGQAGEGARLLTLLPIIQNILFAGIAVVALLMLLSSFGIDIAPLIAGAGVVGVAIGFGAQSLVKDVIAGIFYLFDDAFRIGEYIVSSKYKGTVEGFSLRSVRLRHHRGPIFTVPFGELGAVQNMSRDWVIEKFSIKVDYATDVELARKIVKKIGQQLAEEPEFAPYVLEPMKMQGIEAFGDYGIELRIKMKTKPGHQFTLRRKAYLAIRKAFEENGIKIPFPTVFVQDGSSLAAAAAKLADDHKVAEEAALAAAKE